MHFLFYIQRSIVFQNLLEEELNSLIYTKDMMLIRFKCSFIYYYYKYGEK